MTPKSYKKLLESRTEIHTNPLPTNIQDFKRWKKNLGEFHRNWVSRLPPDVDVVESHFKRHEKGSCIKGCPSYDPDFYLLTSPLAQAIATGKGGILSK